ncbi:UvrD-helicase domain-containing protein [bacterium]|nr:UvrD-helicase domain-containing protein [bacterium]
MFFQNPDEYLATCDFSEPQSELWISDTNSIKILLQKNLLNKFLPTVLETKELFTELENLFLSQKILSKTKQSLIIQKILSENQDFSCFSNQTELPKLIKAILCFPTFKLEELNSPLSKKIRQFLNVYLQECEKLNFYDESKMLKLLSETKIPNFRACEKIVFCGEFFALTELELKILRNFASEIQEVVFIGTFAKELEQLFINHNFMDFKNSIRDFFFSSKENSFFSEIHSFTGQLSEFSFFADWEEELSFIAKQIKKDLLENKIKPDEIAVYVPTKEYGYKTNEIFENFGLPFNHTFSKTLAEHPLSAFIRFFLSLDWDKTTEVFKFLKSPFVTLAGFENLKNLETVLLKSGVSELVNTEKAVEKIQNHYKRKVEYEFANSREINEEQAKILHDFSVFCLKIQEVKNLLPEKSKPKDFFKKFSEVMIFLKVKRTTNAFNEALKLWEELTETLSELGERNYKLSNYLDFFNYFSQKSYFPQAKTQKILVTELTRVSKEGFLRVYQVGMTNQFFPNQAEKNAFTELLQEISIVRTPQIQLFTFLELLKNKTDFRLSSAKLVGDQEQEISEILVDLKLKKIEKKVELETKLYSKTEKFEVIGRFKKFHNKNTRKILEVTEKRNSPNFTEFDGFLENQIENFSEKTFSITQFEEFSACPMKYFFKRELKLESLKIQGKDLETNVKGSLIHKILEGFYKNLPNLNLNFEAKMQLMKKISDDVFGVFEASFDNLYLQNLKEKFTSGLLGESKKGILLQLLENDEKRILEGWLPLRFEEKFTTEIEGLKFFGVIDRIDFNGNFFEVIDYKTGSFSNFEKIREGLSFQLPVYLKAFAEKSGKTPQKASYYDLKTPERVRLETIVPNEKQGINTEETISLALENFRGQKEQIKLSHFNFTKHEQEKICAYCDFKKICRYNALKIEKVFEKPEGNFSEISAIEGESFAFPNTKQASKTELTENQKQALDFSKNIIVTAGAGSGKTMVLAERMLKLIEETKGKIERILVITFTKKASVEMQNRIYSTLVKNLESSPYFLEAKLNFTKNWISTIDSFYLRILRENAIELGLNSEISVSDEQELKLSVSETIEQTIDNLAFNKNESLRVLLKIWSRKQIVEFVKILLEQDWIDEFLEEKSLAKKFIEYEKLFIKKAVFFKQEINSRLELYASEPKLGSIASKCLLEIDKFLGNTKEFVFTEFDKWRKPNKFDEEANNLLKNAIEFLDFTSLGEIERGFILALSEILNIVKIDYKTKLRNQNLYTFADLSQMVYKVLRENRNGIREKLAQQFDFIMVDEFQDTDKVQWEIAKFLAGWNGENLQGMAKNKLFLVGDEKQSIYSFRGVDVQVFNLAKEEIQKINEANSLENGLIVFSNNFRTGKNLLAFFNSFFKEIFGYETKSYEAKHQNLQGDKENGKVNFLFFNVGKQGDQNQNLEEKFIASQVKEILKSNPNEKIALLFRTKKRIDNFAKELENLKVSYIISGGKGFFENQEIQDIFNILAYLSNESKKIELFGFLRSPMVCLSDFELLEIAEDFSQLKKKQGKIWQNLENWRNLVCKLNVSELVFKILEDTNFLVSLFAENDYKQRLKNLSKFFEMAKANKNISLSEFVELLEFQFENQTLEGNATVPEIGEKQSVQLMTIHASKGLEFDTVFLVDAGKQGKSSSNETLFFGETEGSYQKFIGFKVLKNNSFDRKDTFIKNELSEFARKREEAELKRLLYVALTRVKTNLIVSTTFKESLRKGSFLDYFGSYFEELKDKISVESGNFEGTFKGINFNIFNEKCRMFTPENEVSRVERDFEISRKIQFEPEKIYTFSSIKDKKFSFKFLGEPLVFDFSVLSEIRKADFILTGFKTRGKIIHKLMEFEKLEEKQVRNFVQNLLGKDFTEEVFANYNNHYRNLQKVVSLLENEFFVNKVNYLMEIKVSELEIIKFFTSVDRLVRGKNSWEVWDFKVSDSSTVKAVEKEIRTFELKIKLTLFYLERLLGERVRMKLIFSNFGVVEIKNL